MIPMVLLYHDFPPLFTLCFVSYILKVPSYLMMITTHYKWLFNVVLLYKAISLHLSLCLSFFSLSCLSLITFVLSVLFFLPVLFRLFLPGLGLFPFQGGKPGLLIDQNIPTNDDSHPHSRLFVWCFCRIVLTISSFPSLSSH